MKKLILAASLAAFCATGLFLLSLAGCGGDDGPAPVKHTVVGDSNSWSGMFGLEVSGTTVWVAYINNDSGKKIRIYRSTDSGGTFSPLLEDTDSSPNNMVRAAVASDDTLYLFYRQFDTAHHMGIGTVTDASTAASPTLSVTLAQGGTSVLSGCLDISITGTTTFLPYNDSSSTTIEFFSSDFSSGTEIWDATNVRNAGGLASYMKSATEWLTAYIDVTGAGNEIVCSRTTNAGTDWDSSGLNYPDAENIDIAASGDNTVVSFFNDADDSIYAARSANNGGDFSPAVKVSSGYDDMTSIAVTTGYFNLVFTRENGKEKNLCLARSSDNGATWKVKTMATIDTSNQIFPEIKTSGNTIVIAYRTSEGYYLFRSLDNGLTWD